MIYSNIDIVKVRIIIYKPATLFGQKRETFTCLGQRPLGF